MLLPLPISIMNVSQSCKITVPFFSWLIVVCYPFPITDVNNTLLKSYDVKYNKLNISKGKNTEIESIAVYTLKP